jgi:hypothetical protein
MQSHQPPCTRQEQVRYLEETDLHTYSSWESDGRAMKERWESDGRAMRERWASDGRAMGERWASDERVMVDHTHTHTRTTKI